MRDILSIIEYTERNISRKELEERYLLRKPDKDDDDIYTIEEFINNVNNEWFTDYDGFGYLMFKEEIIANSTTICDMNSFEIDRILIPMIAFLDTDEYKVIWFNR